MNLPPYTIIRSKRKRITLQVSPKGLIVKAPYFATDEQIEEVVRSHADWIKANQEKVEEALRNRPPVEKLTMDEIRALAEEALRVIPERVAHYAPLVGVTYGRITIRNQRSKWGSCSSKGNLNFNCLLMLTPPEVIDCIVVHELCHRKEMNHSDRFYAEVLRVYPDYWKWYTWLKENGDDIMIRMVG